jgi:hypothetical protein
MKPMEEHHCPDCHEQMKNTTVTAEGVGDLYIETEREGGLLDRIGVGYQTPLRAFVCSECGLTRFYAEFSE